MAYFTNQNGGETISISPGKIASYTIINSLRYCFTCKGIHGLSNAKLNSPWRKLQYGKERFTDIITSPVTSKDELIEALFGLLSNKTWY